MGKLTIYLNSGLIEMISKPLNILQVCSNKMCIYFDWPVFIHNFSSKVQEAHYWFENSKTRVFNQFGDDYL
jgi:hypothetical protein